MRSEAKNTSAPLSRRTAITLVAASGIAAATSTAIASATTNPDAELLAALGAQLEQIIREWIDRRVIDARRVAEWNAKSARLGISCPTAEAMAEMPWDERAEAINNYFKTMKEGEPADDDMDEHGVSRTWRRILGQMNPLCADILSRRAVSADGLGVQARAASLYFEELWDSAGDDEDSESFAQRSFIESVCGFSGVVPVPVEEAARSGSSNASPTLTPPKPDPIFAAIERHEKAWAAWVDASLLADRLAPLGDKPAKPGHPEAEAESRRTNDEAEEAVSALIDTSPTTVAGAAALLRHVSDHDGKGHTFDYAEEDGDGFNRPWTYWICGNVAEALEKIAVAS